MTKEDTLEYPLENTLIAAWTPPEWVYNCFPLPDLKREEVTLNYVIRAMHAEADTCTEWDGNPLGRVLHVAHMLVSHQGRDGLWSARINLRTGDDITTIRSDAPCTLMQRLNAILESTEFDFAIRRAKEGVSAQKR